MKQIDSAGEHGSDTLPERHGVATTAAIATAVVALLVIAGTGRAPTTDAAPPPPSDVAHGAAGSGRNGFGGSIAPSPTMRTWPGTGPNGNGGPFAFIGAHYGPRWQVPAAHNNSLGVGYCVMEDVSGEGSVSLQPDPAVWDVGEMARAAALMSSFGGDRVVPYGIDASGEYDIASGEWRQPLLFGGGEYTRRRHVAVNFGVKMFVEDVSPSGAVAGLKLARDTAVVDGSGGEFSALRNGYAMAKRLVDVAEAQHAVGGVRLQMVWAAPDGSAPTELGTHQLEVRASDATGKPVGFVPVVALSDIGIDGARTIDAVATVDRSADSPDDTARWVAAEQLGWPTMEMAATMAPDPRFALTANPLSADVTDASGVARFDVTVTSPTWELAFHTQAPTADVSLYAGTGIQGQITWSGRPQSASVHVAVVPPPPPPPPSVVGGFAVRKVLDAADVQGTRDMSGFEFDVTATDGTSLGRVTTGVDGLTPPIETTAGTYTITEVGRPAWAAGLGDGGPVTFAHVPQGDNSVRELTYTNTVPTASIGTAARDASDGDQLVELVDGDAEIIDTVTYTALVPGTEYLATGELMVTPTGDAAGESDVGQPIPTGITGSTRFVPDAPDGSVDVEFAVPGNSPLLGHVVVVYQQLIVAASGRVVAAHHDPDAAEQTIRFADVVPATTSTSSTTTSPPTVPDTTPQRPPTTTAPHVEPPPTTATPPPTTPPTVTATPTTTTSTTTTAPPVVAGGSRLPRTGSDVSPSIALIGLALILGGLGLLVMTTRSSTRSSTRRS